MENQHRKITGYRELNQAEIDLMNEIKAFGVQVGELILRVEIAGSVVADPRWVGIAKTNLQQGLMALTRAVTKPEFF
jgi:hypothetical protein